MEYVTLNNGIKMPMAGIGTFLFTPERRFFWKPSCGLPSTSSLMLWKRHWSGWTPTTLTCC